MSWTIDYYSEDVRLEIDALPVGIRASYARLTELLKSSDSNSECPIHVQWGVDFLISPAEGEGRLSRHDQETTEEDTPPDG